MTDTHRHGDHLEWGFRWCATCRSPVDATHGPLDHLFAFAGKKCPHCKTIWPEFETEFVAGFLATAEGQAQLRHALSREDFLAFLSRYNVKEMTE